MKSFRLRIATMAVSLAPSLLAFAEPASTFYWPGSKATHAAQVTAPLSAATPPRAMPTNPAPAHPVVRVVPPLPAASATESAYRNGSYIDKLIKERMKADGIPGLSVAVIADHKLVHSAGFGVANIAENVPVRADTLFNLASISKPLTAVAALRLAEQGKLDINAPVQQYVPTFPQKQWSITSAMLLGNLAGVRHYKGRESLSKMRYTDVVPALEIFQNDPLVHQPGTAYLYSSYGFNLIGAAIQGASGELFVQYMQRSIFGPALMKDVRVYDGSVDATVQAVGYVKGSDGKITAASLFDATNKIPSGGFMTSAPDLGRFLVALLNGKLLKDSTRQLMWTPQRMTNGTKSDYGMGWSLGKWRGNELVFHSGGQPGFSTLAYVLPKRGFAVVLLSNLGDSGETLYDMAREICDVEF